MLGGYLEFFMQPAVAEMYQSLRRQLDKLIQTKVMLDGNSFTYFYINFDTFCA